MALDDPEGFDGYLSCEVKSRTVGKFMCFCQKLFFQNKCLFDEKLKSDN